MQRVNDLSYDSCGLPVSQSPDLVVNVVLLEVGGTTKR